jgi:hypothetical protein
MAAGHSIEPVKPIIRPGSQLCEGLPVNQTDP